ncbi:MAG: hypothetical protein ABEK59_09265, partial [Halobacteria archaeon]
NPFAEEGILLGEKTFWYNDKTFQPSQDLINLWESEIASKLKARCDKVVQNGGEVIFDKTYRFRLTKTSSSLTLVEGTINVLKPL